MCVFHPRAAAGKGERGRAGGAEETLFVVCLEGEDGRINRPKLFNIYATLEMKK